MKTVLSTVAAMLVLACAGMACAAAPSEDHSRWSVGGATWLDVEWDVG